MIALLLIASLELQLPPCRPDWLDGEALVRLIAAETSTRSFTELALAIPDCERAPEQLQVTITSTAGAATHVVSFTDIPREARLRALAVAIGEIISHPVPRKVVHRPAEPVIETQIRPPIVHRTSLSIAMGPRIQLDQATAFFAQVGLTRPLWGDQGAIGLAVDLGFATAAKSAEQGDVRIYLIDLVVGPEIRWTFPRISFSITPALEIGWGIASGSSPASGVSASSGGTAVVSGLFRATFYWMFADSIGLILRSDGGWVLRGLNATIDGTASIGWDGGYTSATAGVFFAL